MNKNEINKLTQESTSLINEQKTIQEKLLLKLIELCTYWCSQFKVGMTKEEVLLAVDGYEVLIKHCSQEQIDNFEHWLNVYTNYEWKKTICDNKAIRLKELFSVSLGELVLNDKPIELAALCTDVELDPKIEMASKNINVRVIFNNKEYFLTTVLDVLEEDQFSAITNDCGYSDTGGWRDTYRRLLEPMVREFVRDPKRIEQTKEHPHIIIEPDLD